ncbi:MAG: hypothetical protein JST82_04100 [Bacteroidetes bacterium]|nr:hypothetical protein [Bacteroidota bacterium]
MNQRTAAYFNRKKAFRSLPFATDLKSLLTTGLRASRSLIVKKDILKTYIQLAKRA